MAVLFGLIAGAFAANDLRTDPKFRGTLADHVAGIDPQPGTAGMIAMIAEIDDYRDGSVIGGWYGEWSRQRALTRPIAAEGDARRHLKIANRYLTAGDTEAALKVFHSIEAQAGRAALTAEFQRELDEWIALSYLRLGEQQNCFNNPHASACIIPLDPAAVHRLREGSTKAIEYYQGRILARDPEEYTAKWLLNIAYMTLGEYPGGVPAEHLIPFPGTMENYDGPTFANVADFAGVDAINLSGAAVAEDFDNDGLLDLFTTSWRENGRIHFYRRNPDGTFRDSTQQAGLAGLAGELKAIHADLDNDGWLDMYWGTDAPAYDAVYPNTALRNQGGKGFQDITALSGLGHIQKGHAIAFADFDQDGDEDIFAQMGGAQIGDSFANALFRNRSTENANANANANANGWLKLKLEGKRSNRSAIGARIRVDVTMAGGSSRALYRTVNSGGSFGSNPLLRHIGLGNAASIDRVTIQWPASGIEQPITGLELNSAYTITEGRIGFEQMPTDVRPFTRPSTQAGRPASHDHSSM